MKTRVLNKTGAPLEAAEVAAVIGTNLVPSSTATEVLSAGLSEDMSMWLVSDVQQTLNKIQGDCKIMEVVLTTVGIEPGAHPVPHCTPCNATQRSYL